jgi:hypothetical protein
VRVVRWQPVPVVESAGEILPQHVAMVQALLQDLVVTELAANWPSPNPPISTPEEPPSWHSAHGYATRFGSHHQPIRYLHGTKPLGERS